MVAYVHIEYSTYQFSEESKGEGGWNPPPPGPCGTEKSVVLRGLKYICCVRNNVIMKLMLLIQLTILVYIDIVYVLSNAWYQVDRSSSMGKVCWDMPHLSW